jgi:hypothetical protein
VVQLRGNGGGDVVIDRTDVHPEERVDQRALALLELADDTNDGRGSRCPRDGDTQTTGEIGAIAAARYVRDSSREVHLRRERLGCHIGHSFGIVGLSTSFCREAT